MKKVLVVAAIAALLVVGFVFTESKTQELSGGTVKVAYDPGGGVRP
jgi:hypothetical protein